MARGDRSTGRKPATKSAHLRKKMTQDKARAGKLARQQARRKTGDQGKTSR